MTLFFFDTLHDGRRCDDDVGVELEDISEAQLQACQLLSDMMQDDAKHDGTVLTCDVLDANRRVLCRAELRCGPRLA